MAEDNSEGLPVINPKTGEVISAPKLPLIDDDSSNTTPLKPLNSEATLAQIAGVNALEQARKSGDMGDTTAELHRNQQQIAAEGLKQNQDKIRHALEAIDEGFERAATMKTEPPKLDEATQVSVPPKED